MQSHRSPSYYKLYISGNANDMSVIDNVTITPNPPTKKKPITIDAWFTLSKPQIILFLITVVLPHRGKYYWWFIDSKAEIWFSAFKTDH